MASPGSSKGVTKRVVGWYSRDEWKTVYNELFSDNTVSQRHALDKVAVWKCRTLHRLPTAIECSTELVRAKMMDLQHIELGLESSKINLTMAMAVIRFVNLITEKHQNRSYAQSVHSLAEELGLPEWLVDLRHDATHSSLPSMPLLRAAVAFSLGWLQERYWELEDMDDEADSSQSDSGSRPEPLDAEVASHSMEMLLEEYVTVQNHLFQNIKGPKQKKEHKETRQILNKIERLAVSNREQALHCLVQDRFLVPTQDQLPTYNIPIKDILQSDNLHLPVHIIEVWKPCLRLFHHLLLTPQLLHLLSISLTEDSSFRNKFLAGWIIVILRNTKEPGSVIKSQRLYSSGCEVDCQNLLRNIVKSPNVHTATLLESLFDLDDCGLDDVKKKQLIQCINLYSHTSKAAEVMGDTPEIYTLKDLIKNDLASESPVLEDMDEESKGENTNWVLATDILEWSKYPLGTCPGVKITNTNLELFTEKLDQGFQDERSVDSNDSMECNNESHETYEDSETMTKTESLWNKERLNKLVHSIRLY